MRNDRPDPKGNSSEALSELLSNSSFKSADQIGPDTPLNEVLLNSLDYVEFAVQAGEAFGIRITDEDMDSVATVSQLVDLIESKAARRLRPS